MYSSQQLQAPLVIPVMQYSSQHIQIASRQATSLLLLLPLLILLCLHCVLPEHVLLLCTPLLLLLPCLLLMLSEEISRHPRQPLQGATVANIRWLGEVLLCFGDDVGQVHDHCVHGRVQLARCHRKGARCAPQVHHCAEGRQVEGCKERRGGQLGEAVHAVHEAQQRCVAAVHGGKHIAAIQAKGLLPAVGTCDLGTKQGVGGKLEQLQRHVCTLPYVFLNIGMCYGMSLTNNFEDVEHALDWS